MSSGNRIAPEKVDTKRIWWLASYPKSGNTWVRFLLEAYITGRVEINNFYGQFVYGDLRPADYRAVCNLPLERLGTEAINLLRPAALLHVIGQAGGADVCLKTHHARGALNFVRLIPPELTKGAIYVIRDPRDAVISWAHHNRALNGDIEGAIDQFLDESFYIMDDSSLFHYVGPWGTHVEGWTTGPASYPVHVVRYEDLHQRPHEMLSGVLETFGIAVDQERLDRAVREASFAKLRAQEEAEGFVEKRGGERFFRVGKAGQWRDVLTAEQVARLEEAFGPVMRKWGYELRC